MFYKKEREGRNIPNLTKMLLLWEVKKFVLGLITFYIICVECKTEQTIMNADYKSNKYTYEIKEFELPVDHFNVLNKGTFKLRYLYNDTFVKKPNPWTPIFFYTGNEGDIEWFAQNTGFMWELAQKFDALIIFAEHRYYGKSLPFGSASFNTSTGNLAYFTVEQTLEDYAVLLTHLRGSSDLPVIAFGGSYGGMLSAWFRMKYPHIVIGALAASAPIWQFTGLTQCNIFSKITTSVFETAYNSNCTYNIQQSWKLYTNLTNTDKGKKLLSDTFKLCTPIKNSDDLNDFIYYLEDVFANLAMANYPYANNFFVPLPANPVEQFCFYLKNKAQNHTELLDIMQKAISVYTNYTNNISCIDYKAADSSAKIDHVGWNIQSCNQMVLPMCSYANESMFPDQPWDLHAYADKCFKDYGLYPQPNDIILRYGGKNLAAASNIIFSNGLLDPWCGGGVLQTLNDRIYVLIIPEGAHHLDLRASNPADPPSVVDARKREADIIKKWLFEWYAG